MDSNYELKDFDNKNCTSYYFDDIIKIEDFDFDILIGEKSYEDFLVYRNFLENFDWCKLNAY